MIGRLTILTFALTCAGAAAADTSSASHEDALQLLERIATAARELSYSGTFVYQHGERVETSRIVHFVDETGEREKLETLDGPRREIIRNNDEVLCFYPDAKVVRSQKRVVQRSFPALLPEQLNSITSYYNVNKGEKERIAGYDAQAIVLEPKDGMRYGHKLWADVDSGLLLKARTVNEHRQVVEQFAFTQLAIGAGVTREMVSPTYQAVRPEWRMDVFTQAMLEDAETGWTVNQFPPGFRKIMEMRRTRTRQDGSTVVTHMVFSDGMAAVSVFIESRSGKAAREGLTSKGAINIYRRNIGDQVVTVIGEAPALTVMQIGDSVSLKQP